MKTNNPNYKSRVEQYLQRQQFMKLVGFKLHLIEPGKTAGRLELQPEHLQQTGLVHGGLTATLADVVTGFAAYTLVPETHHVVTAELRVSYLHPGKGEALEAIGWVLKSGAKINFCESEIWAWQGQERLLIAKASAVMATIAPQ